MTAACWEIGRRIVECEQWGKEQAEYGETLVIRLAADLTRRFGRGFGKSNLYQMRNFSSAYPDIFQTLSGKSGHALAESVGGQVLQTQSGRYAPSPSDPNGDPSPVTVFQTPSADSGLHVLARRFPLPWSHYVRLLKVGTFTQADAGQMLLYLGCAAEHWTREGENPPVGLILCAEHNRTVAHYTFDRLPDKVLAAEKTLAAELERTQATIESRLPRPPRETAAKRKGGSK